MKAIEYFGWCNIAMALCLAALWLVAPQWLPHEGRGIGFTLALQGVVSSALIFASQQRRAGTLLGTKTFPATLVAYGLFLLMAWRWLNQA
ncbi:hypothetical protein L1F30_03495 [Simiduia sp. 21SJ11W-1]|uniref:hypothetical protein n=1 Tax=Simiduia sp. 21SJ11W-1 TaxID=2909669 RepID=UPI0020A18BBD|nr:hypothetical protein [Simiduia sp. 21SJ11W-1]UTA48614.1 hypothetical protein L1F30_03495 [Simiduia sp. 21SJ11W-1]